MSVTLTRLLFPTLTIHTSNPTHHSSSFFEHLLVIELYLKDKKEKHVHVVLMSLLRHTVPLFFYLVFAI